MSPKLLHLEGALWVLPNLKPGVPIASFEEAEADAVILLNMGKGCNQTLSIIRREAARWGYSRCSADSNGVCTTSSTAQKNHNFYRAPFFPHCFLTAHSVANTSTLPDPLLDH